MNLYQFIIISWFCVDGDINRLYIVLEPIFSKIEFIVPWKVLYLFALSIASLLLVVLLVCMACLLPILFFLAFPYIYDLLLVIAQMFGLVVEYITSLFLILSQSKSKEFNFLISASIFFLVIGYAIIFMRDD
jgi:hypothetical protein